MRNKKKKEMADDPILFIQICGFLTKGSRSVKGSRAKGEGGAKPWIGCGQSSRKCRGKVVHYG